MAEEEEATIFALPEGCQSKILTLTSPWDACRAAAISKQFKSVADSDIVWEQFLPSDYHEVIARAVSLVIFTSKKQLYHRLSDSHLLLDRGYLSFKLDKRRGKKCYMLGARELSIAGQDDTRYVVWRPMPESRFLDVAVLKIVCWLDIRGQLAARMMSANITYVAYLVYQADRYPMRLDLPAKAMVSFGGIGMKISNVYLKRPDGFPFQENVPLPENAVLPGERNDGWMEIKLGEVYCDEGDDGNIEMVLQEIESGRWKHGLIIEGIELRPK